jgi:Ca2+/Na+ antiporter
MPIIFLLILICCMPAEMRRGLFLWTILVPLFIFCLCCIFLYSLPYGETLCWLIFLGFILFIFYCVHIGNEESEKAEKRIKKKIHNMKKSNIVYVISKKLYAISLKVSDTEIVLLHPTLLNVPEASKNYFSQKEPYVSFSETKHLISDVSLVNGIPPNPAFYTINQIASVAKDLYINIDPQNEDLRSKLAELQRLEKLARFSNLYNQQADLYSRAAKQIQELLDIGYKLRRECSTFMVDILIGQELAKYNTDDLPDVLAIRLSLDNRCKLVSDQYQLLKSEMEEYMNLKNGL